MNVEPKDKEKLALVAKANNERERAIANQWLAFSRNSPEAWDDFMQYGHSTSEMLTTYAKEMVMPSPVKEGEEIILTIEKSHSLLQTIVYSVTLILKARKACEFLKRSGLCVMPSVQR